MTAPETRWTAETEELVASRGAGSFAARDILEALHEVGLLLTPGFTRTEEWCVAYDAIGGRDVWSYCEDRTQAEKDLTQARSEGNWRGTRLASRGITTWPDGTVLTGPWIEVPS